MTKKQYNIIRVCHFLAIATIFLVSYLIIGIKPETKVYGYPFAPLMIVITLISIPPLMIMGKYVDRVRIRKLKLLASRNGWDYEYFLDVPILKVLIDKLNLTLTFNGLHSNYEDGIVGRISDWKFTIFDGNVVHADSDDTEQTIFVLNIKDENLPVFGLEPASLSSKLLNSIKKSDIDFGSHPRFSKKYQLYGENESEIRRLFKDEVLNLFGMQEKISVFAYKNNLVMYQYGKIVEVASIEDKLNLLVKIAKLLI